MSDIYLSLTETPTVVTLSQPVVSGALSSTVTVANTVTVALDANSLSALEQVTVTIGAAVSISNFPSTQTIAGTVTIQTDLTTGGNEPCVVLGYSTPGGMTRVNYLSGLPIQAATTVPVSGTVTANPAGVQTISGTVTANLSGDVVLEGIGPSGVVMNVLNGGGIPVYPIYDQTINAPFPVSGTVTVGNAVTIGSLPAISGAVSVRTDLDAYGNSCVAIAFDSPVGVQRVGNTNGFPIRPMQDQYGANIPLPVSGTVTIGNAVTIGSLPAISGTVTAAAPNGALTTRFGTPTTASVAFATSCVTNANRKYLLIQNVTTGSNVITVGIGFTPTTTQGIQLTAGAGITFESSYIPTGQIFVLSSVTASNFTILEA